MPRALWLQGCFPSETRKSITYKSCPSTGVCWSMKICFSHLPDFQLLPYGMCEEKRWHENLFNNPRLKSGLLQLPFSFTVMPPLNRCHGESREFTDPSAVSLNVKINQMHAQKWSFGFTFSASILL